MAAEVNTVYTRTTKIYRKKSIIGLASLVTLARKDEILLDHQKDVFIVFRAPEVAVVNIPPAPKAAPVLQRG